MGVEFSMAHEVDITIWTNADMMDIKRSPFAYKVEAEKVDIAEYTPSSRSYHCTRMPIVEITPIGKPDANDGSIWAPEAWLLAAGRNRADMERGLDRSPIEMHFGLGAGTQCLAPVGLDLETLNFTRVIEFNRSEEFKRMGLEMFIFTLRDETFNSSMIVTKSITSSDVLREPRFEPLKAALMPGCVAKTMELPVCAPKGGHYMFPSDADGACSKVQDPVTSLTGLVRDLKIKTPFYYGIRVKHALITKITRMSLHAMLTGRMNPSAMKRKPSIKRERKYISVRTWEVTPESPDSN